MTSGELLILPTLFLVHSTVMTTDHAHSALLSVLNVPPPFVIVRVLCPTVVPGGWLRRNLKDASGSQWSVVQLSRKVQEVVSPSHDNIVLVANE